MTDLYLRAFPEEPLFHVVSALLEEEIGVMSLVCEKEGKIAGHVMFTDGRIAGSSARVSVLGPLAVFPAEQRSGIGTALVEEGLTRMRQAGAAMVCVLGDPAYYGRFGFEPELHVTGPYPLPEEWTGAWQSITLDPESKPLKGMLSLPPPWLDRALWLP